MRIAEVAMPVPLHRTYHYEVPPSLAVTPGCRVRASFGPRSLVGMVVSVFDGEPERKLKALDAVIDYQPLMPAELLETAVWLSTRYSAPIGDCVRALTPGVVGKKARSIAPLAVGGQAPAKPAFTLTPGQEGAVQRLSAKLAERRYHAALIFGVPASGKTEVYLRLIRQAVAQGGQALFLLPEISLTAPFFVEFARSLDVPVVLWHSRLGGTARRQAWLALRNGEARVVVGARSAALLPFKDLRLVVMDEEQDESFKQEEPSPFYHAREVMFRRAERCNALYVLGSATPSLETWDAAATGKIELLRMDERVSGTAPPHVALLPTPQYGCISEGLLAKLKARIAAGEQSILLVNRRGHSTLVMCFKCGWVDRCPDCGVAKIEHQLDGRREMRCHHCSAVSRIPEACPICKNVALRAAGMGTQKVVAELKGLLPKVRVLRMDKDTLAEDKESLIYESFKAGGADILVGTKLVAKSFHFPDVTLVGVVDADTMLHRPDFRSSERTLQLLAQVAGRSGRASKPGEVVIQTLHPDHDAVAAAACADYALFADKELVARRELGYPPYTTLVRLLWMSKDPEAAALAAAEGARHLRGELEAEGHEVVGPAPSLPPMLRGHYRHHFLVKLQPGHSIQQIAPRLRACPVPSGVKLRINVDPYEV